MSSESRSVGHVRRFSLVQSLRRLFHCARPQKRTSTASHTQTRITLRKRAIHTKKDKSTQDALDRDMRMGLSELVTSLNDPRLRNSLSLHDTAHFHKMRSATPPSSCPSSAGRNPRRHLMKTEVGLSETLAKLSVTASAHANLFDLSSKLRDKHRKMKKLSTHGWTRDHSNMHFQEDFTVQSGPSDHLNSSTNPNVLIKLSISSETSPNDSNMSTASRSSFDAAMKLRRNLMNSQRKKKYTPEKDSNEQWRLPLDVTFRAAVDRAMQRKRSKKTELPSCKTSTLRTSSVPPTDKDTIESVAPGAAPQHFEPVQIVTHAVPEPDFAQTSPARFLRADHSSRCTDGAPTHPNRDGYTDRHCTVNLNLEHYYSPKLARLSTNRNLVHASTMLNKWKLITQRQRAPCPFVVGTKDYVTFQAYLGKD